MVDGSATCQDRRASASSPLASLGFMYGSPLSDHSTQHSDSGIVSSDGVIDYSMSKPHKTAVYSRCVLALYALAKDPSPQIAKLGQKTLSIIGIEQVITKPLRLCGGSVRQGDSSPVPSPAGLARSYSWLDMYAGPSPLAFRTPPVSPPRQNILKGLRRVCSLEFIPHQLNLPDSGLADPVFGSCVSGEQRLFPQSTFYRWSCDYLSRPLLTAAEDSGESLIMREERERFARDSILKRQHTSVSKLSSQIANWDTKFDRGTRTMLLLPFSPFIVAADQSERIRIWNYEEGTPVNSFENHDSPDKGISKLCLLNELDDSLLLVASSDGTIRVWKDFTLNDEQKLVTAFSSNKDRRPGMCNVNAVVDWQQQSGYLYASLETSIVLWDLDKEQLVNSIPSSWESCISALSASQVQGGQVAVGYDDGFVRLFDIRTPSMLMCTARPHVQKVERVVGIDFQPGLDLAKIVSASQAGDIQLLDTRYPTNSYLTIEAHRGSLTALAVHQHAPVIASGSDKQLVKVFSLEGGQLSTIRYSPTFMTQRSGSINCLTFHPYHVLLAAGASDACVSIYTEDNSFVFNG